MSASFLTDTDAARSAVGRLFADKPPLLVEVRFPNMGTIGVGAVTSGFRGTVSGPSVVEV